MNFLKVVLGTLVGLILFSVLSVVLLAAMMVASGNDSASVKPNSVLRLRLQGTIQERSEESIYSYFGEEYEAMYGLDDIVASIRKAAGDENIKGILIEPGAFSAGFSSLQEIRQELQNFKRSGKFIYAYSGAYTQGGYYLSSVADSVFLNPEGVIDFRGLAYSGTFYKNLLEKLGVEMQVVKVGSFKSYTEMFTNEQMSDSSRLQAQQLVGDLWNVVLKDISASRHISTAKLKTAADSFLTFRDAKFAFDLKMVDKLAYGDEVTALLKNKLGVEASDDINYVSTTNYAVEELALTGDKLAVLYAVGEIDNGSDDGINTKKLCKQIKDLEKDSAVKAVVLRVNSPGGSAYGSEQVWHALSVLKKHKPLVVSMGDYAASGGYYISSAADYIVANPTTMTGSIGIFGVIPNAEKLAEKLGVSYDVVTTNAHSDFPSLFRRLSDADLALVQQYVNRGYDTFLNRCATGRGVPKDSIAKYAQGRVWSGNAALQRGLVDTLGTLDNAVSIAAREAGLKKYTVESYPKKEDAFSRLLASPSLGVKMLFAKDATAAEKEILDRLNQLDCLQAAMPFNIVVK